MPDRRQSQPIDDLELSSRPPPKFTHPAEGAEADGSNDPDSTADTAAHQEIDGDGTLGFRLRDRGDVYGRDYLGELLSRTRPRANLRRRTPGAVDDGRR